MQKSKRGRGRPKGSSKGPRLAAGIWVRPTKEQRHAIERYADGRPMTEVIRRIFDDWIASQEAQHG